VDAGAGRPCKPEQADGEEDSASDAARKARLGSDLLATHLGLVDCTGVKLVENRHDNVAEHETDADADECEARETH
jgi:hypothetical protein